MTTRTVDIPLTVPTDAQECERCATWLSESLVKEPGIEEARINVARATLSLTYDPQAAPLEVVERRARELGMEVGRRFAHETFPLSELDCPDCGVTVERAVGGLVGVLSVAVNYATAKMVVEYETERVDRDRIVGAVRSLGYDAAEPTDAALTSRFRVGGMDCADCVAAIERTVGTLAGVHRVRVNFAAGSMAVRHDATMPPERILGVVDRLGYTARLEAGHGAAALTFWRRHRRSALTLAGGIALVAGLGLQAAAVYEQGSRFAYLLAMLLGGYPIARAGLYATIRARSLDINVLVTIAALGAAAIGEWLEGATVVVLFALGNLLEALTADRARGAIRALVALSPHDARVRRVERDETVPVERVQVGDVVAVRPGERIPVDGVVVLGASAVNQAPITGEAEPVAREPGDTVFAGTINERGYLEIRATKRSGENTLSRIIHLVQEAQAQRSPSQRFISRFARYYTPSVIALSALVAIGPPLLGEPFAPWLHRGLVLLVLACPCALVISTPVAVMSAITSAARLGVLIKGGAYLEEAGTLSVAAFDKTGTITTGRPEVVEVAPTGGVSSAELMAAAAAVESRSQHPLAAAILRHAWREGIRAPPVTVFESYPGRGASAQINGRTYYAGNLRLFREVALSRVQGSTFKVRTGEQSSSNSELGMSNSNLGNSLPEQLQALLPEVVRLGAEGTTAVLVGSGDRLLGVIAVADRVRPGAAESIRALRASGIRRTVMLSGDSEGTVRAVAAQVGMDEYRAELLPEQKVEAVRALRARHGKVAMIGDGVNDAPALASATIGVAMGVAGADVALETADVALMADDLSKVAYAIDLSRATVRIMRQNIALSLLTKAAAVALAAAGVLTLWLAVLSDVGMALVVTVNSMRLLRRRLVASALPAHAHVERTGAAPGDGRYHGLGHDHNHDHSHGPGHGHDHDHGETHPHGGEHARG